VDDDLVLAGLERRDRLMVWRLEADRVRVTVAVSVEEGRESLSAMM
jgi:hypothetical protein